MELDGESLAESGYIIERLLKLAPASADVETTPSDDSLFWNHFAEGSLMSHFQFGAMIQASSGAWVGGQAGDLDEGAKEGIKKYAGWFYVSLQATKGISLMVWDRTCSSSLSIRPTCRR